MISFTIDSVFPLHLLTTETFPVDKSSLRSRMDDGTKNIDVLLPIQDSTPRKPRKILSMPNFILC